MDKKIDLNLFFTLSYFSYVLQATLWIPQIAVKVFINLSLRDATIKKQKKQMFGINHTATSNSYRSRNSEQRERNAILEVAAVCLVLGICNSNHPTMLLSNYEGRQVPTDEISYGWYTEYCAPLHNGHVAQRSINHHIKAGDIIKMELDKT